MKEKLASSEIYLFFIHSSVFRTTEMIFNSVYYHVLINNNNIQNLISLFLDLCQLNTSLVE